MDEYPALRDKIENLIVDFIQSNTPRCTESILELIDIQSDYVNANTNATSSGDANHDAAEARYVPLNITEKCAPFY